MTRLIVLLAVFLVPAVAGAQSQPNAFVPSHPMLPWGFGIMTPAGQLLRDVWVSPRTVVVDTFLPVPAEASEAQEAVVTAQAATEPPAEKAPQYAVWRQTAVVPGYWVRQTTAGDYYPQRWELEQLAPGNYRWRLLPAEVRTR
jgi:hypothetical protein